MKTNAYKQLTADLSALRRNGARTWGQIGQLLNKVEQSGYWRNDAQSFTEWVTAQSKSFGLKKGTFFRCLTAGRYYEVLREKLVNKKNNVPPLDKLPDSVSPENLELLSKLERVTPPDLFQDLARKTLSSTITRTELRTIWQAYRPILAGRTAQGRGVSAPQFNPADRRQYASLLEAKVLTALTSRSTGWSGINSPALYEVFMQVKPESKQQSRYPFAFDAIVLIRDNPASPLVVHGIEVTSGFAPRIAAMLNDRAPFCDRLWIAVHEKTMIHQKEIPDYVGILCLSNQELHVERPTQSCAVSGTRTEELIMGLLLKVLHRE